MEGGEGEGGRALLSKHRDCVPVETDRLERHVHK